MISLDTVCAAGSRLLIARAPEGLDARLLAEFAAARRGEPILHVARDDARMARLAEAVAFFAPEHEIVLLPAWDCLPYDRVSPNRDILAQRIEALTRLAAWQAMSGEAERTGGGRLVITTVNGLLQRLPPRSLWAGRALAISRGGRLDPDRLNAFLQANGYQRVDTVGEPGEYAVRGGLLDLFPPGTEQPLRLDFFGDELESIRSFDAISQRSVGELDGFVLKPVSEVILEPDSIERFRTGYRELFGRAGSDDPLYAAVSEGRAYAGMEHWLPLFHDRLETLFDYLPEAPVTLDHQAVEARDARLETILDFYEARHMVADERLAEEAGVYRPVPPDKLFLLAEDWDRLIDARPGGRLSPFDAPDDSPDVVDAGGRPARSFVAERIAGRSDEQANTFDQVCDFVRAEQGVGRRVLIAGYSDGSSDRLGSLLGEHGLSQPATVDDWLQVQALPAGSVALATLGLESGFGVDDLTVIAEQDILGERMSRVQRRRRRGDQFLTEVSSLQSGDLVVHVDHGIGRYEGLQTIDVGGAPHDCLRVVYQGNDKLFVPVENIEVLSRFGSEESGIELDRLGGAGWQARKARAKERIREIADELIRIAAARQMKRADALAVPQGLYQEFAARFPYAETEDQQRAIEDTIEDLASGRPMDRLICGDVGFGKTEVALRAAFLAVMSGKQVAVVVPTTLLCRQHYQTIRERFAGLPIRIAQLSRLVGPRETATAKSALAEGSLEIVVGTHALLSKSVAFKDLGLLIVDEEQHFGVKQKERLKALRQEVHVLTLTATPIPRTLQMAMSGVKEMSLIATPPVDRLAVRTFVLPYDPVVVREAILREHFRGGQVFYVCPRISDLEQLQERLVKLVPEVKIAVAHGQMTPTALEKAMTGFYERQYDLLLSTNIIESGLDIPTANTIIVHRADMFGLSQLYQLRGRIGRSKIRGYAYLTLPPGRLLTPAAEKRLHVMQTLDSLGAGFTLASHDLDIRGAGNLLGEEQSGHIREVGIELYQQMLEEAVSKAREGGGLETAAPEAEAFTPQINLGTSVLIPESYVPDLSVRLGLYRRLADLVDRAEIEAFAAELIDRFGPLPEEVDNLLHIVAIKQLCRDAGVAKVDAGPKGATVAFHNDQFANPEGLIGFIESQTGQVSLRPDHRLVYRRVWDDAKARLRGVRHMLEQLARVAARSEAA